MSLRLSTGLRNALAGKIGLPHAILTGATGTFVDNGASPDSITDSGNGLITAGFEIGDWIKVFGATTPNNNNIEAKLLSVAAGTMTFATGQVDTGEVFAAGASVVACKGGSLNDLFKHGTIHMYTGVQPATADLIETPGSTLLLKITEDGNTHVPASGLYGLEFEDTPAGGVLTKLAAQSWEGLGLASDDLGWFRFYDQSVTTGADVTGTVIRFDGSIDLSGAQINVASLGVQSAVTFVLNNFTLTVPAS